VIEEDDMSATMDPAAALARLAVGVMLADGRVTAEEWATARTLDQLGLGPMRERIRAELEEAAAGSLDFAPAIATVAQFPSRARSVVFEVLSQLAAADGELSSGEVAFLERCAAQWQLAAEAGTERSTLEEAAPQLGRRVPIRAVEETPAREEAQSPEEGGVGVRQQGAEERALEQALAVLGLPPNASAAAVEQAFRTLVQRYDPAAMLDLGPEFVLLAIRRLQQIADAYVIWKSTAR
jgi:DnaJ-domain-containing protein 1